MNKFHVVCSDDASSKIESIHFKLNALMLKMCTQASSFEEETDKIKLMTWFITNDVFSKLNDIRYEILDLVNNESDYILLLEQIKRVKSGRHYFNPARTSF